MDPKLKVASLFDEFKKFAFKGNVVDLAVGVVIGAAFGKIVDSLVKNLVMPAISLIVPANGGGYTTWTLPPGAAADEAHVPIGLFLGDVVNFMLVALVLFLFIKKFLDWMMRSRKQELPAVPALTKDQELLAEIRDLLKRQTPPQPAT
jgi:large conductance mechanosensitive channel